MNKRKHDVKMALKNGVETIRMMREEIRILQMKEQMLATLSKLINVLHEGRGGHGYDRAGCPDAAWIMQNLIHEIEEEEKREEEDKNEGGKPSDG